MLEVMAGELMNLKTERMQAEEREKLLRTEINRRIEYQRTMESDQRIVSLERIIAIEWEKRESQRQEKMQMWLQHQDSREVLNSSDGVSPEVLQRSLRNEPSSPFHQSRRYHRSGSKISTVSREGGTPGHDSIRSLNTKSVSSKSAGSSGEESGSDKKGMETIFILSTLAKLSCFTG